MNIDDLKLVTEVARQGSFAATARLLDRDPSSVSRSVADLETKLGLRLFHRSTRKLSLTDAGGRFLGRVTPLVEGLEDAVEEARASQAVPEGHLRMTCSVAFGVERVVPLMDKFQRAYPSITLEIDLSDAPRDLVREGIDIALRLAPAPTGDLVSRRLGHTRYSVCAAPRWIEKHGHPAHPRSLATHQCLRQSLPEYRTAWLFRDKSGQGGEVPVQGSLTLSNPLALRAACEQGLGPALLADWLTQKARAAGQLVGLFPEFEVAATSFDTGVWLLYPSRSLLPRKTRAFIDFLAMELRN